jgi:hypothetical protein
LKLNFEIHFITFTITLKKIENMAAITWNIIKQIDAVLEILATIYYDINNISIIETKYISKDEIMQKVIEKYPALNSVEFKINLPLILEQLVKTEYALTNLRGEYFIAFAGKVFCINGGYSAISEREKRQTKTQNLKDFLLIGGSWIASVAGCGLLYFEYVKLNHHNPYGLGFLQISFGVSTLLISTVLWIWLKKSPNKLK